VHAGNLMRVRSFKEYYAGKFYFEVLQSINIEGGFLYYGWNELGCNMDQALEFKLDQIVYDVVPK
jgi:hypothetical protein